LKVERYRSFGRLRFALRGLEAEHCSGEIARGTGQATDFKSSIRIGYGGNFIGSAKGRDSRSRNWSATGTYNASLYVRSGTCRKQQEQGGEENKAP
jgi:hypothetical protein